MCSFHILKPAVAIDAGCPAQDRRPTSPGGARLPVAAPAAAERDGGPPKPTPCGGRIGRARRPTLSSGRRPSRERWTVAVSLRRLDAGGVARHRGPKARIKRLRARARSARRGGSFSTEVFRSLLRGLLAFA